MAARAYAVHHVPGRTRLRIPERRGDPAFFEEAARRLARVPGVHRVDANPLTGSVLVHHAGDLDSLLDEAFGSDAGELMQFVLGSPALARLVRADIGAVDGTIRRWSGGELDLGTVAAFGLIGLAGVQLMRGQQAAVSFAWYATELMRRWSEPERPRRARR